ncbi:MAG: uroporphyrinogen-III synthase [Bacteroidetes bacterium]|nr:uroporphyrinogen-III synthase [Bacteroidota bacterium]MBL0330804.1 uroporphyrinogen-III synthase [Bacteroidota bacterium]
MISEAISQDIKSVFISRKVDENGAFTRLKSDSNITLIDEPLIEINPVRYSYTPQTKWIFFSSKNSITYFFAQNPILPANVNYGVVSIVSANYLLTFGKEANFIGQGNNMLQIAKDFKEALKNDTVLFPQAIDSLQSIQKQLSFTNTCYNLYVYKTSIKSDFTIPYTDILIFTSPSNVLSYFNKYKIDSRQLVIAMGDATKYKLTEYGIFNVLVPNSFSENGLYELLFN